MIQDIRPVTSVYNRETTPLHVIGDSPSAICLPVSGKTLPDETLMRSRKRMAVMPETASRVTVTQKPPNPQHTDPVIMVSPPVQSTPTSPQENPDIFDFLNAFDGE